LTNGVSLTGLLLGPVVAMVMRSSDTQNTSLHMDFPG
jgi:hypothetical protein